MEPEDWIGLALLSILIGITVALSGCATPVCFPRKACRDEAYLNKITGYLKCLEDTNKADPRQQSWAPYPNTPSTQFDNTGL